jgi:hypothetical protein
MGLTNEQRSAATQIGRALGIDPRAVMRRMERAELTAKHPWDDRIMAGSEEDELNIPELVQAAVKELETYLAAPEEEGAGDHISKASALIEHALNAYNEETEETQRADEKE